MGGLSCRKKLIVGAQDLLIQILREDEFDFSYLQNLRQEYLAWKTSQRENPGGSA